MHSNSAEPSRTAEGAAPSSHAWVDVDIAAFERNVRNVQKLLETDGSAQLCAVLKADAYGAGVAALVPSLVRAGIPYIGVAENEEARQARAAGFRGRLLRVRTATSEEMLKALDYDMEELVGNGDVAVQISRMAIAHNRPIRVHIALNSAGMSRDGLEVGTADGKAEALRIVESPGMHIVGIMTHFADAERSDVIRDLETFRREADWLFANSGIRRQDVLLHAASSLPTLNVRETHLDMVRTGAVLYGCVGPRPAYSHVLTFKSLVASVSDYPAGNTVGYDRTATLQRPSRLANILVGYADGYRRAFSNEGSVLIRGHRAPVVGRVSMNTITADVTDIPKVCRGDEAVLFGRQAQEEIGQADVERISGLILADLFASWGRSNPRRSIHATGRPDNDTQPLFT